MIARATLYLLLAYVLSSVAWATSLEMLSEGSRPVDLNQYTTMTIEKARIDKLIKTEKDRQRRDELSRQSGRLNMALSGMRATSITTAAKQLYSAWQNAPDPDAKKQAREKLSRFADRFLLNDIRQDLTYGERLKKTEIRSAIEPTTITLAPIREFEQLAFKGTEPRWSARRISADRVEIWMQSDGWLLDAHGKLFAQARVPSGDERYRTWWGAFLPDGRWATDQPEPDRQFHIHGADGKLVKSIPIADILKTSGEPYDPAPHHGQIDWARSDADGKGWILQIRKEYGEKYFSVSAAGNPKAITRSEAFAMAYPRALGPQGFSPTIPSDDGSRWLMMGVVRHGPASDTPFYMVKLSLNEKEPWRAFVDRLQPGEFGMSIFGGSFDAGFWPAAREVFIVMHDSGARRTWFFDENGALAAWVDAPRIADARDGKSMLFETSDGQVLTMRPDQAITASRKFAWPDGAPAKIEMIFADLNLGLFRKDRAVWLATWK